MLQDGHLRTTNGTSGMTQEGQFPDAATTTTTTTRSYLSPGTAYRVHDKIIFFISKVYSTRVPSGPGTVAAVFMAEEASRNGQCPTVDWREKKCKYFLVRERDIADAIQETAPSIPKLRRDAITSIESQLAAQGVQIFQSRDQSIFQFMERMVRESPFKIGDLIASSPLSQFFGSMTQERPVPQQLNLDRASQSHLIHPGSVATDSHLGNHSTSSEKTAISGALFPSKNSKCESTVIICREDSDRGFDNEKPRIQTDAVEIMIAAARSKDCKLPTTDASVSRGV